MNLRMVIPVEIAVVAALGAIYFGYHAVQDPQEPAKSASSRTPSAMPSVPKVNTTRLVNKKGGFAVGVPDDVKAKKVNFAVQMTTADKVISVLAGPAETGTIAVSRKAFMRAMKQSYTDVRVVRSESKKIDGRKAKATYGRAMNAEKKQISFVNVVVKATPRNYAIYAFTAADSDPLFVVPRVNAIINSFEVID